MSKAAVFVATTQGPSRVLRLIEAPHQRHSAACLQLKPRKLPISAAYHEFISFDGGVVAAFSGCEQYRLDLSENIDDGESWQLGIFIAHALAHTHDLAGALAEAPEDVTGADCSIWATGALDADLSVKEVEHIERKLALSEPLFERLTQRGSPVLAVLPEASKTTALAARLNSLKERFPGFDFRFEARATFDPTRWLNKSSSQEGSPTKREKQSHIAHAKQPLKQTPMRFRKQAVALGGVAAAAVILIFGALAYNNRSKAEPGDALTLNASSAIAPNISFTAIVSPHGKCFPEAALHAQAPQPLIWGDAARATVDGKLCSLVIEMKHDGADSAAIAILDQTTGQSLYETNLEAGAIERKKLPAYLIAQGAAAFTVKADMRGKTSTATILLTPRNMSSEHDE